MTVASRLRAKMVFAGGMRIDGKYFRFDGRLRARGGMYSLLLIPDGKISWGNFRSHWTTALSLAR
jgi:hypothetical protein